MSSSLKETTEKTGKLLIDFTDEDSTTHAYLTFKQEGRKGLKLPLAYLAEMLNSLETVDNSETSYFWKNYGVVVSRRVYSILISTQEVPLLQLTADQRAKLVVHLKSTYAAWL